MSIVISAGVALLSYNVAQQVNEGIVSTAAYYDMIIGPSGSATQLAMNTMFFTDEPLGYDLQQFMIDGRYQNKGYGSRALHLILDELRREGHYDHVELCVKKADTEAIRLYEKFGFTDSGYIDENLPDSLNMICHL